MRAVTSSSCHTPLPLYYIEWFSLQSDSTSKSSVSLTHQLTPTLSSIRSNHTLSTAERERDSIHRQSNRDKEDYRETMTLQSYTYQ